MVLFFCCFCCQHCNQFCKKHGRNEQFFIVCQATASVWLVLLRSYKSPTYHYYKAPLLPGALLRGFKATLSKVKSFISLSLSSAHRPMHYGGVNCSWWGLCQHYSLVCSFSSDRLEVDLILLSPAVTAAPAMATWLTDSCWACLILDWVWTERGGTTEEAQREIMTLGSWSVHVLRGETAVKCEQKGKEMKVE